MRVSSSPVKQGKPVSKPDFQPIQNIYMYSPIHKEISTQTEKDIIVSLQQN